MGIAAVIFLNNPPKCNCSFLYGKKETLAKGKGNVYKNLLGNVLNNHVLALLNSNTMWLMHAIAM